MALGKIRGKWRVDFYVNGRRQREIVGDGRSKVLAEQVLHSIHTRIAESKYLPDKRDHAIAVGQLLNDYWDEHLHYRRDAFRNRSCHSYCVKEFGNMPIGSLTRADVLAFQRKLINAPTVHGTKRKPASVNKIVTYLSTAINYAIKMDKIHLKNPCYGIPKLPENNARDVVLTNEQYEELFRVMPGHLQPLLAFAFFTGCRRSEVLRLRRCDINLKDNVIHVRDTKNSEDRFVPIAEPLKRILLPLLLKCNDQDNIFTFRGKPMTDFHKGFRSACRRVGLEYLRFHDLRHTALTNWHNQGHSHFLIMQASGHKTLSCFQRYLSFRNNDLQKLVLGTNGHAKGTEENVSSCNAG